MSALSDRNGADARRTNCGEVTTKRTAGEVNGENRFAPNSAKRSRKSGTNLYHAPSLQRIRKHSLLPPTRPHNLPPLSTDPSLRSRFGRASVALRSRFGRASVALWSRGRPVGESIPCSNSPRAYTQICSARTVGAPELRAGRIPPPDAFLAPDAPSPNPAELRLKIPDGILTRAQGAAGAEGAGGRSGGAPVVLGVRQAVPCTARARASPSRVAAIPRLAPDSERNGEDPRRTGPAPGAHAAPLRIASRSGPVRGAGPATDPTGRTICRWPP